MRKATRAILPLVCLLAAACGDDNGGDDDGDDGDDDGGVERRLVLFHTNDEHSHLFGFAPEIDDFPLPTEPGDGTIVGSIARRGELLDQERAALDDEGIDSLTVSAGDQTQGALPQIEFAETSPDFALMAEVGYDIMAPGNHEFDLGPEAYAAAIEAVPDMPPIVSTNIVFSDDPGDDTLEALYGEGLSAAPITPYQILATSSGIRVGFVGIMGVNASDVAPNKVPVNFSTDLEAVYASIQPAVDALRDQDVDLVVALSHSGVDLNTPANGEDFNIAQNVEGIDIIVSGHTHTRLDEAIIADGPDGPVPIVQTGSYGRFLGRVELVLPADGGRATLATSELLSIDDTIVPSDDSITSQLDALIADLEATVLPAQISRIEGAEVTDDPKVLGDLYYRDMGATEFDIIGQRSRTETNMLNLSNDAKLAAAEEFWESRPTSPSRHPAPFATTSWSGETGVLSYADLYPGLPAGREPDRWLDRLSAVSILDLVWPRSRRRSRSACRSGYVDDSFYLSASGLFVEYDTTRDPQDLAASLDATSSTSPMAASRSSCSIQTATMSLDETDDAIFDSRSAPARRPGAGRCHRSQRLHSVVTTLYIASFADDNGIPAEATTTELELVSKTPSCPATDGSDVKDYESFIRLRPAHVRGQWRHAADHLRREAPRKARFRATCSAPARSASSSSASYLIPRYPKLGFGTHDPGGGEVSEEAYVDRILPTEPPPPPRGQRRRASSGSTLSSPADGGVEGAAAAAIGGEAQRRVPGCSRRPSAAIPLSVPSSPGSVQPPLPPPPLATTAVPSEMSTRGASRRIPPPEPPPLPPDGPQRHPCRPHRCTPACSNPQQQ